MGLTQEGWIIVPIVITIIMAVGVHYFIEKPIIRWQKEGLRNRK